MRSRYSLDGITIQVAARLWHGLDHARELDDMRLWQIQPSHFINNQLQLKIRFMTHVFLLFVNMADLKQDISLVERRRRVVGNPLKALLQLSLLLSM